MSGTTSGPYPTLNKFGVPTVDNSGIPGDMLQLKFKYRFRVVMVGFGLDSASALTNFTQQVQSVSRPTVDFQEIPVHSYNSTAYMAGKHNWGDINCTVKDDVNNSVSRLVSHQLQKQLNFYDQQATAAGVDYKFNMFIEMLDGTATGNAIESWLLEGCFLKNVNYQDLDYGDSAFMTIQMTIRCDNATCSAIMDTAGGFNLPLNSNGIGNTLD